MLVAPEFGMVVRDLEDTEPAFAIGRMNHSEEERYMGMMKQQQFGENTPCWFILNYLVNFVLRKLILFSVCQ